MVFSVSISPTFRLPSRNLLLCVVSLLQSSPSNYKYVVLGAIPEQPKTPLTKQASLEAPTMATMSVPRCSQAPASTSTTSGPPLVASYNQKIRPLLDAVDKLRHMEVMKEGIQLPTIVVVGDQSSGKSSVLESLSGITLPRGQGICTRVPLVMRLQDHPGLDPPELLLQYHGKTVPTSPETIVDDISFATYEIAGPGKNISKTPLTLLVKKDGVPDLTMVDLPGITRVPVQGQPDDIYEQVSSIIMEYIAPEECIILNVLSATVDFPTCESIRMSQQVDRSGDRTLAVVTKADKAPEGLREKVTADDVGIGLGYICVRNRIGDETYEDARAAEARLFESNSQLCEIDRSMVGVPMLAQRLMQIQADGINRCLPDISMNISTKLSTNSAELKALPEKLETLADAMTALIRIIGAAKESLRKILIRGEYDEYPDDQYMHCTARLAEMLDEYVKDLRSKSAAEVTTSAHKFLMEEIGALEESKGFGLPNFLPRSAFITLLQRKVSGVAGTPVEFINKVWVYIEDVVVRVLMKHSDVYPQLQAPTKRSVRRLLAKLRDRSQERIREMVEMEKLSDYTTNPEYMQAWTELMADERHFMGVIDDPKFTRVKLRGFGEVDVAHLVEHKSAVQQAFDMKMRITAYWKIVIIRLVDSISLHLLYSVKKLINEEMEEELVEEVLNAKKGGIERLLEEAPATARKREKLKRSIEVLKDANDVVSLIIDKIAALGDDDIAL